MIFSFDKPELEWLDSCIGNFVVYANKTKETPPLLRVAKKMKHKFRTTGQVNLGVKEQSLLKLFCDIRAESLATSLSPEKQIVQQISDKLTYKESTND